LKMVCAKLFSYFNKQLIRNWSVKPE